MSRTVLLTGAAGFLGAACARALCDRGDHVVALVRDRDPRSPFYTEGLVDRCVEVRAELADAERLLAEYRPDAVLHLGAQSQVPVANASPMSTFESNVRGTWVLLEACRLAAKRPEAILVASSDKAYGEAPLPYREQDALRPSAPYDVSKACADLVARSYALHFELPVVVSRSANLYGPGDLHADRLVPEVCRALAAGEAPVLRSSGAMSREWLYVDDGAEASIALLDAAPRLAGRAVNLGGGEVATVREVVQRLYRLAGRADAPPFAPRDPEGEIPHQALDCATLRGLGWSPAVDLDAGLGRTLAWTRGLLRGAAGSAAK